MSLDVLIMHIPPGQAPDHPSVDRTDGVLGTGAQVRAVFTRMLPGCATVDGELRHAGDGFTMTALVDEPDQAPVTGVTVVFDLHGGDPRPVALALAAALDELASSRCLTPAG